MKIAFVSSLLDRAGQNIRHHLLQLLDSGDPGWQQPGRSYEFIETEGRLIHAEGIDKKTDADLVIFISRHSSVNPVPVLTVHITGNFREADLGGTPRTLAPAATGMMQAALRSLARHCPEGYRVSYEVTHHGPTGLHLPSFFAEIGSTEKEWTDPAAGLAVAQALLTAVPQDPVPLIGFGGTHYAARQTEIALTSRGAFGHIAHTREIATLDAAMLSAMMAKSGAVAAYIDRKALNREDLNRLSGMLAQTGIPRLSESEILSMGHLSWERYQAARQMAGTVSPGARVYVHDMHGNEPLAFVQIDPVLLGEALKSDEPGLVRELSGLPVMHLATQDNRMLNSFITDVSHSSQIINALNTLCVKIIRSKEITATEKDLLIITKVRFDPDKAREFGVPAGPFFKQLAGGQPVEIDGRTITPAMVSSGSDITIHIPGLEKFS
ncbi:MULTISPECIES: D-aminoacyl-tRNA deacylase [unclassified Methanoregula]|uniref:D-aminoacyl-tRNA deacylase n=1 Tax=unclassified Methanoregula TaxID=2649730 RepID=UPI0009C8E55B|nr:MULTISPECIES: D-aminoacyl-tRNA deacylase [unclassified Methanoregula]OPX64108.1 MAG: D-tyrosyl-tRNA(Tyr) deacylase [Methanoregula sp. PtaB.Bin085]OPY34772.1 MAG: D-tyrosyl-tRNA(Tyr) deacylase [Methanoregula sp. PtaU1.Bin006]